MRHSRVHRDFRAPKQEYKGEASHVDPREPQDDQDGDRSTCQAS